MRPRVGAKRSVSSIPARRFLVSLPQGRGLRPPSTAPLRIFSASPGRLAAIGGAEPLARTEIVKRVWDYSKANACRDPAGRRKIVVDDKLRAVFGQDRVKMMSVMGLLSPHLKKI